MYLTAYAQLAEFVHFDDGVLRKHTDIRASFESLVSHFSEPLEVPCEGLVEPLGSWDYNVGGRTKVRELTNPRCKLAPMNQTYLSQIADQRRELSELLSTR